MSRESPRATPKRSRGRAALPSALLLLWIVLSLGWALAWGGFSLWLGRSIDQLPDPRNWPPPGVVEAEFGADWTSMTVYRWWGESSQIGFGWRGATIRDKDGNEVVALRPHLADGDHLIRRAGELGGRGHVFHRAVGWPLRVWVERDYRMGDDGPRVREGRIVWSGLAVGIGSAILLGAAGALLLAAIIRAARRRRFRGRGRCPSCGYPVADLPAPALCPECGTPVGHRSTRIDTDRKSKVAADQRRSTRIR